MVDNEFDAQFFEQFLDDFYAEADEHLRSVRRHLLEFEDSLDSNQDFSRNTLNELFRSFHTLKGISAMANVSAAETLAHHMEDYLRLLRDGHISFARTGLEALIDGTKKIEQIVIARRENKEIPNIDAEILRFESMTLSETEKGDRPASFTPELREPEQGNSPNKTLFKFRFEPSSDLADRNININEVRSRLESIGTIQDSKPLIIPDGKVAFEIIVSTDHDESEFIEWQYDGISVERLSELPEHSEDSSFSKDVDSARKGFFGQSNTVRVDLSRLDDLMLKVGELVITRAKLGEQMGQMGRYLPSEHERDLQEITHKFEKQLRDLRDGVMRVRMVPIGEIFERMQFVARDIARETGKRVRLEITGENTEIDKLLVERMLDPLLHLVRNAISHGIESPADRQAVGKPIEGTVGLHAEAEGESVVIEISDDGRGIDLNSVATRAGEGGFVKTHEELDDEGLLEILCAPGFSTKEEADKTSGRGVGMDVVKRIVDDLGGTLTLKTEQSRGTAFMVRLPLTLSIAEALIVTVDNERFAVPQTAIREILEIEPDSVTTFENNEVVEYRGEAMPLVRLAKLFNLVDRRDRSFHAFVIEQGKRSVGIAVDRVIGQREIVVRTINDPLLQVTGVSGATELGDGRAVLILNVPELVKGSN